MLSWDTWGFVVVEEIIFCHLKKNCLEKMDKSLPYSNTECVVKYQMLTHFPRRVLRDDDYVALRMKLQHIGIANHLHFTWATRPSPC